MPSFPCHHPTCVNYVASRGDFCPDHAALAPLQRKEYHKAYDQARRDPAAKAFYDSKQWQSARSYKLGEDPACEICGKIAEHVHHRHPLRTHPHLRLTFTNLQSVCGGCHSKLERDERGG